MSETLNTYNASVELVERFAGCLLKDCKSSDDLAAVKQLGSYIIYFSNEIDTAYKRDEIFEVFLNNIDSATEKPDSDSVLTQFNKEIEKKEMQLNKGKKCEKYKNFMKMVSQYSSAFGCDDDGDDDDDNDIRTVSETVNTIDPISKLPIVDPVKNKKCGHIYEKSTILQLIKQNPKTRCPIAGCDAVGYVKKDNLVPDNVLKRMLSNISSNSQKKIRPS